LHSILVVEDDAAVAFTVREMLSSAGYQVTTAANGVEAIEAYRRSRSDLVVTDLIMPEKDGLETIIDLRRGDPAVRMLAMSGGGRTRNMEFLGMARRLGVRVTLSKPFTREELLMAVATALED